LVVLWSLIELPWETDAGMSVERSSAILTSKLLLLALAVLWLKGITLARGAFAFLCLVSVIVIAIEMSAEYTNARNLAFLSAIELAEKLGACIAIVCQLGLKARPPSTRQICDWPKLVSKPAPHSDGQGWRQPAKESCMTTQTFLESLLSLPPGAEVREGDLASMVDQEFARLSSGMPAQDMMRASQMESRRRTARMEARSSVSPDELDRKTL
jgi:hypothetical protein